MDSYSSLLRKHVNCVRKKFYNNGPWCQCCKNFFIFVMMGMRTNKLEGLSLATCFEAGQIFASKA